MNILYLSADNGIPIRGHKGSSVHVRALTDAFVRAGHRVTILTTRAGPGEGPAPLAELIQVPLPEMSAAGDARAREERAQASAERLYHAARDLLASRSFDFIYERYSLWSEAGARLARETGLPFVLEVNAPLRQEAAQYRELYDAARAAQIETEQFTHATALSVVSETLREYAAQRGAAPDRVYVLPNAVDAARFHPLVRGKAVRKRYHLQNRIVVGFVGKARPWHDLDTLCAAFAELYAGDSRYHLLLVGDITEPAAIEQYGLKNEVTLTGPVAHEDVPEYIAACNVAVAPHPPRTDFYFSPLKLFEYLACGVPTVAANLGQPASLVRHAETGYLYAPGDARALAEQIRHIVALPKDAAAVAWNGAAYVLEHHTWDKNARRVLGWVAPQSATADDAQQTTVAERVLPLFDSKLRQRLYRATRADLAAPLLARYLEEPHPNPLLHKEREYLAHKEREQVLLPSPNGRGVGGEGSPSAEREHIERIEVLKYKPTRRCVLAYELRGKNGNGAAGTRRVIGKVFRDERGQRLLELQQYLWDKGFGTGARDAIHVPRALAYIPELRMLVQERARGATLNALAPQVELTPYVRRSAQGLAKLHRTAPPFAARGYLPRVSELVPRYALDDERANLNRFAADLVEWRPDAARRVRELRAALDAWADQLPPARYALIHRDFYYSQVLFDDARLTLIDFDLLSLGDPAIDVANFTAHLAFMGLDQRGDLDAFACHAQEFLDAYARFRSVDASFWLRVEFYAAATFFRLMHVVTPRPGLKQHFDTLYFRTSSCVQAALEPTFERVTA